MIRIFLSLAILVLISVPSYAASFITGKIYNQDGNLVTEKINITVIDSVGNTIGKTKSNNGEYWILIPEEATVGIKKSVVIIFKNKDTTIFFGNVFGISKRTQIIDVVFE